jgi:hypothetical protein
MVDTPPVIDREVRLLQPVNAFWSMLVIALPNGIDTLLSAGQPANVCRPIAVRVAGSCTDVREAHPSNTPPSFSTDAASIVVIWLPDKLTDARLAYLNTPAAIERIALVPGARGSGSTRSRGGIPVMPVSVDPTIVYSYGKLRPVCTVISAEAEPMIYFTPPNVRTSPSDTV